MRLMDYYYNLHNKLRVHLRQNRSDLATNYGHYWRWANSDTPPPQPNYLVREYAEFQPPADYFKVGGGHGFPGGVYFPNERYALTFEQERITEYTTYANRATNLYSQLLLVPQGISLVHAAGLSLYDKGIIFPAAGGVGKTTLISQLKDLPGFSFFGDDFVMLDRSGVMSAYPSDLSIYHYHLPMMPELKDTVYHRYLIGRVWLDKLTRIFTNHRLRYYVRRGLSKLIGIIVGWINLQSAPVWHQDYVKVPIEQVIQKGQVGHQTKLAAAVFLQRHSGSDFKVTTLSPSRLASMIDAILNIEFRYGRVYVDKLAIVSNIDVIGRLNQQRQILESGLSGIPLYQIDIPASAPTQTYAAFMKDFIQQKILSNNESR
ncbi:hypothetical protein JXA59_01825 [Patescibacteria group bacterium]|nr:hypothetical protein [Patescibacteria group bacterium]